MDLALFICYILYLYICDCIYSVVIVCS